MDAQHGCITYDFIADKYDDIAILGGPGCRTNSEGTKPEVKTRSWVKIIQSKCCVLLVAKVHSSEATIS